MLEVLFKSIPKVTNEFIFILGILGFSILCLRRGKKSLYIPIVSSIVLAMVFWRMIYRIESSRYASIFIYLFSILAAYFLSSFVRYNSKIYTIPISIILLGIMTFWAGKNYGARQINSNLKILAQLHDHYNKKTDIWRLIIHADDSFRIRQMEKFHNSIRIFEDKKSPQDVSNYIKKYKSVDKKILFAVTWDKTEDGNINTLSDHSKYRHVLSIFFQGNQKKRMHVYTVESKAELMTLSQKKAIERESGILTNGDLEILDSPELSYKKYRANIGQYSLFFDYDESKRTPANAYFHNDASYTQYLPYYNCLNSEAISGKNSAKLIVPQGTGFLLFSQKFNEGTYQFSITLSGTKGTEICLLYDLYKNKKWIVMPLAYDVIHSKGIFKIKTSFSVSGLKSGDYFIVGAWVNGEALLDNFCLTRK